MFVWSVLFLVTVYHGTCTCLLDLSIDKKKSSFALSEPFSIP